jgi:ATP-dependent Clp protease protease subunit
MSAQDAKVYGLIDEVIKHPSDLALQSSGIPMYVNEV